MKENNIQKLLENKIEKACVPLIKKFEKEKDDLKKLKIQYQIAEKSLLIFLTEVKKLSNQQWEKFAEEHFTPIIEQSQSLAEKFDTLVMKQSKNSKEYEKYQKLKKIHESGTQKIFDIIDTIELNKRQLERLLALQFISAFQTQNVLSQNNLDYYEFNEAGAIVKRRFGFDYYWLICLSLIQLYENLIRKKVTELGHTIKDNDTIEFLISQLIKLIKEKEERDISIALKMSEGLKKTRNAMTHSGFNQNVSKSDLERIFKEIVELEKILYPS